MRAAAGLKSRIVPALSLTMMPSAARRTTESSRSSLARSASYARIRSISARVRAAKMRRTARAADASGIGRSSKIAR
jgi:hypothetical protein